MKRALIVLGGNYGDEGKGLVTAFLGAPWGRDCLNILYNGGPQRGHTVELSDGRRHVFHHFGAATFSGASSYYDSFFCVNPVLWVQELGELQALKVGRPCCWVAPDCRVTTMYDMMLNQMLEESRGGARHGSCGYGIFETRLRYERCHGHPLYSQLLGGSASAYRELCDFLRHTYLPGRLREEGVELVPEQWRPILADDRLIARSWEDFKVMGGSVKTAPSWETLAGSYGLLLFEGAQGLALDENNLEDYPYLTPSSTTSLRPARLLASLAGRDASDGPEGACSAVPATEIVYVTRSYFTRHGAGPLPGECPARELASDIEDRTNVPNPFQKALRYAPFEASGFLRRQRCDLEQAQSLLGGRLSASLCVTQLNLTGGKLTGAMPLEELAAFFSKTYLSCSPLGELQELS